MGEYLRGVGFYEEIYDLMTVKKCLGVVGSFERKLKEVKKEELGMVRFGLNLYLYYLKGERYRGRKDFIEKCLEKDRKREEKIERTKEPQGIYCLECQAGMKVICKDLYDMDCERLRVLFFFECLECCKRRGVFEDGCEYERQSKVGEELKDQWEQEDIQKKQEKLKDQRLLETYRQEFCLSGQEGEDYVRETGIIKSMVEEFNQRGKVKADPGYQKAKALVKLTVVELEVYLKEILEKNNYIHLVLGKPEIGRYVVVAVMVQDQDSLRSDYESVRQLQKLLKKTLKETNWRLMSHGIIYRLGCLTFELKGYEREEDLIKIVQRA